MKQHEFHRTANTSLRELEQEFVRPRKEKSMFGPPKDVEDQCNARLILGDDYGDNSTTFRCPLPLGHEGVHKEEFKHGGGQVTITWERDERVTEDDDAEPTPEVDEGL